MAAIDKMKEDKERSITKKRKKRRKTVTES